MIVYVDTHVLVWIGKGEREYISADALHALDDNDLLVSPAVILELEFFHEIGRLRDPAEKVISMLESQIGLHVCSLPFHEIVTHALREKWTRDPFDRLITANAKAAGAPLVTKDERIRKHYRRAIW
jgi:PIN domain nuclease of toxin-antitoxin system